MTWVNWIFFGLAAGAVGMFVFLIRDVRKTKARLLEREIKDDTEQIRKDIEVLSLTELLYRSNERLRQWRESRNGDKKK